MKLLLRLALLLGSWVGLSAAQTDMLPVIEHNGNAYVTSADLAQTASIAIKRLTSTAFVACADERCAQLSDVVEKDKAVLVSIAGLSKALGLKSVFSDDRRRVRLEFESQPAVTAGGTVRVGDLAPNLRLAKLGGGEIALAELRGKRVLINSWASW